jgi:hypothetical protein
MLLEPLHAEMIAMFRHMLASPNEGHQESTIMQALEIADEAASVIWERNPGMRPVERLRLALQERRQDGTCQRHGAPLHPRGKPKIREACQFRDKKRTGGPCRPSAHAVAMPRRMRTAGGKFRMALPPAAPVVVHVGHLRLSIPCQEPLNGS